MFGSADRAPSQANALSFLEQGRLSAELSTAALRDLAAHAPAPLPGDLQLLAAVPSTDEYAGLHAAADLQLGDLGVFDYVLHSAPSVQRACDLMSRYLCLLMPGLEGRCERHGDRLLLHVQPRLPLAAVVEDALLAALYRLHVREFTANAAGLECWFTHRPPTDAGQYAQIFGAATCRFNAPCSGFVLEVESLALPLPGQDARLQRVVSQLAEIQLAALPRASSFAERIRPVLARELGTGPLTCQRVARLMRMSPRTVARKLEAEGSTFYAQVDEVRKQAALRALARPGVALCELSFSLGFAHVASFHRAFKRWTGETPATYRRHAPGSDASAPGEQA